MTPDELKAENANLRQQLDAAKDDASMSGECLGMVADRLKRHGCKCGPDAHKGTPPMMYDDWISCAVWSAVAEEREAFALVADKEIEIYEKRNKGEDEHNAHGLIQTSLRIARNIRERGKS